MAMFGEVEGAASLEGVCRWGWASTSKPPVHATSVLFSVLRL